jgi:aspartyl-tRNA(Asn)/glutamyl-tRNA(Gln) amidotransferase subunit A
MTVDRWLSAAVRDVRARGLDGAVPVLEAFARAMTELRAADWTSEPVRSEPPQDRHQSPHPTLAIGDGREAPALTRRLLPGDAPYALDILTASARIREGSLTSVALAESCLARIEELNGDLNAFITVTREDALAAARDADSDLAHGRWRGPLHGIPISLKDLIDQQGVVTTAGSAAQDRVPAAADAPVTVAVRRAGAVLVGKTNLHEYAFGTTSDESAFGPVRHPADRELSPGGSSGGSAVAVATGMSLASIGTDTGGSIRIPSAACGLVGLKPGTGEISCDGVVPLSHTLDHVGPIARTVADAALLYHALAGLPDVPAQPRSPAGLRIGVLREYFEDLLDAGVRSAIANAQDRLREAGASLAEVRLPHADAIAAVYLGIVFGEAAAIHGTALDARGDRYQPGVRLRLEAARFELAEDYLRALRAREVTRAEVDQALASCDVLIAPTLPIAAPPIGAQTVAIDGTPYPVRNVMLRLTQPFNLSGHPVITLPCGVTPAGLSCGMQLIGRRGRTQALLDAALGCEPYVTRGFGG